MRRIRGAAIAATGLLALGAMTACSSAVAGHGAALDAGVATSSAPTSTHAPVASSPVTTPAPSTTTPSASPRPQPTPTPTPSPSATRTTEAPLPQAPPPYECPDGQCPELSHSLVKDGYQIILRSGTADLAGSVTSVVELVTNGVPTQWNTEMGEYQPHLTCSTKTLHLHCVVLAGVGAHASQAQLYLVVDGQFAMPEAIFTNTPGIHAQDLDGDGDLDLQVPINDYLPSYAEGGTYWQTLLLKARAYGVTGCTPTVNGAMAPMPTTPVFGTCPP